MFSKVGDAIENDDIYSPVFSDVHIQGYKERGKLIADLTQALLHGGIKSTNQTVSRWLAKCWDNADQWEEDLDQGQEKGEGSTADVMHSCNLHNIV